jgi:TIR domain
MRGRSPYAAGGTYHVFLSFSKERSLHAAKVAQHWIDELLHAAVRVFIYGPDYAMVGENWLEHVYDGAKDSDAFIAFLTPENFDNYWIKEELQAAGSSARCQLILLVLLDGLQPTDLPAELQSRQAKLWSPELLKNLLVLIGREAGVGRVEAAVKAQDASIIASFL